MPRRASTITRSVEALVLNARGFSSTSHDSGGSPPTPLVRPSGASGRVRCSRPRRRSTVRPFTASTAASGSTTSPAKPLAEFPVRAGWLRAVRRCQRAFQRGRDLRIPVLVPRSSRSVLGAKAWTPERMSADAVVHIENMGRYAPCLGRRVDIEEIPDAMHEVLLSRPDVRSSARRPGCLARSGPRSVAGAPLSSELSSA